MFHNEFPIAARRVAAARGPRVMRRVVLSVVLSAASAPAWAAVPWHPDLDTARAAARVSQRPVIAVFTARWSRVADSLDATTFASPEVQAVLSSGFEPVRIDVDAQPGLARALGISHVPTACILGPGDTPLATFEVTNSAPEFVSAALQAVRQAAAGTAVATATDGGTGSSGSIAVVTGKVRGLTEFAAAPGVPSSTAVATDAPGPSGMPAIPPAWPAEKAGAPPTSDIAAPAPARPAIEPVAPPASASWLGAAPTTANPAPAPAPEENAAPPQSSFMAALQRPLSIFSRAEANDEPPAVAAPAPPPTMPPARPQFPTFFGASPAPAAPASPATPAAPASPSATQSAAADALGPMPVGLEGYCPVTLATKGTWAEGRAQWGARHRGRTYLFVGAAEQQAFLADPDRYAPALSGDDPVLALDGGTSRPGQRRYGVTYQSRTYLFASPETRSTFAADPSRYAARIVMAERGGATRVY